MVAIKRYPDEIYIERRSGSELLGWRYEGLFDQPPAAAGVEHRVIAWDEVSMEEGTGIVHIAPGAARRISSSRAYMIFPSSRRSTRRALMTASAGCTGSTSESAEQISADLADRGRLVAADEYVHRYPFCWRCHTPLIFRIADDWFIGVDEVRPRPRCQCDHRVDAGVLRQADGRLAPQHGRLEHLPPPLLRTTAPHLSVHMRPRHRGRLGPSSRSWRRPE